MRNQHDFIDRIGLLAADDGLARTAGRLVGFLLLNTGTWSLDQLAEALSVSKASVSTNARMLERLGLVERLLEPGDRRDFYCLSADPWARMFDVVRRRMERMRSTLAAGEDVVGEGTDEVRHRLEEWEDFYAFMLDELEEKMARWQARREARVASENGGG